MNTKILFGILIITAALAAQVQGQSGCQVAIPGLYNTGVDSSGSSLPGGSADSHWSLSGTASGSAKVLSPGSMYVAWSADSTKSAWIGVYDSSSEPTSFPYYFNETFSLAGLDPTTAVLSGTWWGDDITSIELNGHVINTITYSFTGTSWSVNDTGAESGWFNSGLNTLTVEMNSADGSYDGVRVEVTGTATSLAPQPATATATVADGYVTGAIITSGGCGYTNAPLVLIQGGGGTNATAIAVINNGIVTQLIITQAGVNYTSAPTIFIGGPPAVPAQPQSTTANAGETVSFSVTATGSPPPTYQWLFDGTNLTDNGQIIGSQSNFLTLTNVALQAIHLPLPQSNG